MKVIPTPLALLIADAADRPELVARLRSQGLSQQQIGDTLGVSRPTVTATADLLNADSDNEVTTESRTDSAGRVRPVSYQRREHDPGPAVAEAVVEFPELAHYADTGRTERVLTLAAALRGYDEPELAMRRDLKTAPSGFSDATVVNARGQQRRPGRVLARGQSGSPLAIQGAEATSVSR